MNPNYIVWIFIAFALGSAFTIAAFFIRDLIKERQEMTAKEVVPAATTKPLHQQGEYKPSPQMRINQQRAAELYPHRLITPDGIGNGADMGQGQRNRRFSV